MKTKIKCFWLSKQKLSTKTFESLVWQENPSFRSLQPIQDFKMRIPYHFSEKNIDSSNT